MIIPGSEETEILISRMSEGDPNCPYALGSRVRKVKGHPKDHHPNGTEGTVMGSAMVNDIPCYLVSFDCDSKKAVTFIPDTKLEAICNT